MNGIFLFGKKQNNVNGPLDDLYNLYDKVLPDLVQPEKVLSLAFDPDFYERNFKKITSDPLSFISDTISNFASNAMPDWVKDDVADQIYQWVYNWTKSYINSNFQNEIRTYTDESGKLITDYNQVVKTPAALTNTVASSASGVVLLAANALPQPFGGAVALVAAPMAYNLAEKITNDIFQNLISSLKSRMFPDKVRELERIKAMTNFEDKDMVLVPYSQWNSDAKQFEKFNYLANNLPDIVKSEIVSQVSKYTPILTMSSDSFIPTIETLDEFTYSMLYSKLMIVRQYYQDETVTKEIYEYIAITIWNARADALNYWYAYALNYSGMGYASFMNAMSKQAFETVDTVGRWAAEIAKNAAKEKQRAASAASSASASASAANASYQQAIVNEEEQKKAATQSKAGLATLATVALSLLTMGGK